MRIRYGMWYRAKSRDRQSQLVPPPRPRYSAHALNSINSGCCFILPHSSLDRLEAKETRYHELDQGSCSIACGVVRCPQPLGHPR